MDIMALILILVWGMDHCGSVVYHLKHLVLRCPEVHAVGGPNQCGVARLAVCIFVGTIHVVTVREVSG